MVLTRVGGISLLVLIAWSFLGCGGSNSSSILSPPAIAKQPSDQTVTVGQEATFAVVATGTGGLTYQWQKNAQPIPGATAASYTTAPTTKTDDSSRFQVVISNSAGQVMSAQAVLSVNPPPDVTTFHNDNLRTGQN